LHIPHVEFAAAGEFRIRHGRERLERSQFRMIGWKRPFIKRIPPLEKIRKVHGSVPRQ
jgi:hypothetical protein